MIGLQEIPSQNKVWFCVDGNALRKSCLSSPAGGRVFFRGKKANCSFCRNFLTALTFLFLFVSRQKEKERKTYMILFFHFRKCILLMMKLVFFIFPAFTPLRHHYNVCRLAGRIYVLCKRANVFFHRNSIFIS